MSTLSPRLASVASLVRENAVLADIGTDHAYLPIYLVEQNKIQKAVASDVATGPLERAKNHILGLSLENKIETFLTNGLENVEQFSPTDIVIAGMGGELIASILEKSKYVLNTDIHLILQPMSKEEALLDFLSEKGFEIEKELLAREENRLYRIILCHFTGKKYTLSPLERICTCKNDPLYYSYLEKEKEKLQKIIKGKKKSKEGEAKEETLLLELLLKELNDTEENK